MVLIHVVTSRSLQDFCTARSCAAFTTLSPGCSAPRKVREGKTGRADRERARRRNPRAKRTEFLHPRSLVYLLLNSPFAHFTRQHAKDPRWNCKACEVPSLEPSRGPIPLLVPVEQGSLRTRRSATLELRQSWGESSLLVSAAKTLLQIIVPAGSTGPRGFSRCFHC